MIVRAARVFLAAAVAALALAAPASAEHVNSTFRHWPGTTVGVNGGGCAQPCVWFRVWDRTGYTGKRWANQRVAALEKIRAAFPSRMSVQFSIVRGSRFDLERVVPGQPKPCPGPCEQTLHYNEALLESPPGTVFVGRGYRAAVGSCEWYMPLGPMPEPYCQGTLNHVRACAIGAGFGRGDRKTTFVHEFGHCIGLGHPHLIPCPAWQIMCAQGGWGWSAHDKAELARAEMYGHSP